MNIPGNLKISGGSDYILNNGSVMISAISPTMAIVFQFRDPDQQSSADIGDSGTKNPGF
jgi:hypothetical protein